MKEFLLSPTTQVFLGWKVSLFVWIVILITFSKATEKIVDRMISKKKLRKKKAEELVIHLDYLGAFVLATAIGAVTGLAFGSPENSVFRVPAVASLYNPMIGLYLLFVSWKLKLELHHRNIE